MPRKGLHLPATGRACKPPLRDTGGLRVLLVCMFVCSVICDVFLFVCLFVL